MAESKPLIPARQLAAANKAHFPNESPQYRAARNALLVEELELRRHLERVAIAVSARSPIERLREYKQQRGFANLPFVSDNSGDYTRTYVSPEDADVPGFSVFPATMRLFVTSTVAR